MIINKVFAIVMLPVSILIILEATNVVSFELPFNIILIGSILMIALQVLNLIFAKAHNGHISLIQFITAIIFSLPALAYFATAVIGKFVEVSIPMMLGVMMLVEGVYALH